MRMQRVVALVVVVCAMLGTPASQAAAQEVPGGGGWQPGPGAVLENTYQGFVDQPSAGATIPAGAPFRVAGWAVDSAAEGWAGFDDVQVLHGSTVLARGSVGGSRPDVASVTGNGFWASSGFEAIVPAGALQPGQATLIVQLHTPGKGSWFKQVNVTVGGGAGAPGVAASGLVFQIVSPGQNEEVPGNRNGLFRGTAYDTRTRAELGVGVDRIQVYLDAHRGLAGSQYLGDARFSGNQWEVTWEPTLWNSIRHHVVFFYVRSAVTGEEVVRMLEIDIGS
jgi:hypothetical protein